MSQYTPKEISTIADKFKELVAERKIGFQLDAFGNPVQEYSREAMDQLSAAITALPNFPVRDVVENAMLAASTEYSSEIFTVCTCLTTRVGRSSVNINVCSYIKRAIHEAAFLEISEHLFTTKQIQAMLRQHPDYLSVRESDIRTGRLEREELEDLNREQYDIASAEGFKKAFKECA